MIAYAYEMGKRNGQVAARRVNARCDFISQVLISAWNQGFERGAELIDLQMFESIAANNQRDFSDDESLEEET